MYSKGHEHGTRRTTPTKTPQFDAIQAYWLAQIEAQQAGQAPSALPQEAATDKAA